MHLLRQLRLGWKVSQNTGRLVHGAYEKVSAMTVHNCQLMDAANHVFVVLSMQRLAKHSGYAFSGMADVGIVPKQAARIDHFSQCFSAEHRRKLGKGLASLDYTPVLQ